MRNLKKLLSLILIFLMVTGLRNIVYAETCDTSAEGEWIGNGDRVNEGINYFPFMMAL